MFLIVTGCRVKITWWVFIIPVIALLSSVFGSYDDTDDQERKIRSGVSIRVDYRTGCQYLVTMFGGITPRMEVDGRQVCQRSR